MLFRTHVVFGFLLMYVFSMLNEFKVSYLIVALIASVLPDIDTKLSIGKYFWPVNKFLNHRGFSHTLVAGTLLALIVYYYFGAKLSSLFFVSYISHIVLDAQTLRGVRPLFPFKKRFKGKICTGHISERLFYYYIIITLIILFSLDTGLVRVSFINALLI